MCNNPSPDTITPGEINNGRSRQVCPLMKLKTGWLPAGRDRTESDSTPKIMNPLFKAGPEQMAGIF